jgi:hypothetical protein
MDERARPTDLPIMGLTSLLYGVGSTTPQGVMANSLGADSVLAPK